MLREQGRPDEARQELERAVAFLERLQSPLELGRTLLARAELAPGAAATDRRDVERAAALFDAAGAVGDLERARSAARRLVDGDP